MNNFFYRKMPCIFGYTWYAITSMAQDSTQSGSNSQQLIADTMQVSQAPASKILAGEKPFRTWSIGVHAGVLAPTVAIGGSNDFSKWKPTLGYGIYVKHQFFHAFGLQAEFIKGELKATNEKELGNGDRPAKTYSSFNTDINWSANLSGILTLANINWLYNKYTILPYITAGAGIASYNPHLMTSDKNQSIDYKPDGSIKELFIPVGVGLRLNVSSGINIDIGYQMNFLDGDNLDGYYSSPGHKDKYGYAHAGLEFALGSKDKMQLATHNPVAQLATDLADENAALKSQVSSALQQHDKEIQEKMIMINNLNQVIGKLKADTDGDGVSDYFDKCTGTVANKKVDGSGCPLPEQEIAQTRIEITAEDRRIVTEAFNNLQFDFGKATISSSSYSSLDRLSEILITKGFSLKLAGHTDNVGSESANLKLSKDRAEAVKAYLVAKGANPSRIEATGYGETQPIASNKTSEGRQQNRRVEFTLY